jgi:hypothetical protein
MTKPATGTELRKLLASVLQQWEDAFCNALAATQLLERHGIPATNVRDLANSDRIRGAVHSRFQRLLVAIKAQDDEAFRQELLHMPTPYQKI